MHLTLKTRSYIWITHILLLFSLNNYWGTAPPPTPCPSPSYDPAKLLQVVKFSFLAKKYDNLLPHRMPHILVSESQHGVDHSIPFHLCRSRSSLLEVLCMHGIQSIQHANRSFDQLLMQILPLSLDLCDHHTEI